MYFKVRAYISYHHNTFRYILFYFLYAHSSTILENALRPCDADIPIIVNKG
jgi:hypothetical protein